MKKTYDRLIISLTLVIILFPIIVVFLVNNLHKNDEPIRYDFEMHTIEYLSAHLDDFEKMCEYDLDNYSNYERGDIDLVEPEYLVPKSDDLYNEERTAIFQDLGIKEGFNDGYIYPDSSKIVFTDNYANFEMTLIYYKDGNSNQPISLRIGDHFVLICYEYRR